MATVRLDIEDFINDGYEFPATGGTLEIYCEENSSEIYSIAIILLNNYENVISDVTVENGDVYFDDATQSWLVSNLTSYDYFSISITVPANETTDIFTEEADFLDVNGDLIAAPSLSQVAGSSPAPVWGDGQHKIYRSGNQVMKMYRSGELIYLRFNPASDEPEPPTPPEPTYQWVEVTADFDRSLPFTKVRWDFSKSWNDGFFSELPNINCDNKGWTSITGAEWGYAGQYTMNLSAKKCYIRNQSTGSYDLYDMYAISTQVDTNLYEYESSVPLYWGGVSNSSLYNNGLGLYVYVEVNPTNE